MQQLIDNVRRVQDRIATAATRAGRSPQEVMLVAVTKYVDHTVARAVVEAGCMQLGEARPQELIAKAQALSDLPVAWHLIGHLQRNKAKKVAEVASLIHSGDSLRLLEELNTHAAHATARLRVLLEVNISGDATKHGFAPEQLEPALERIASLAHLQVCGLMAMSGLEASLSEAAEQFDRVRALRDKLSSIAPPNVQFEHLSMGMSDDFEVAIAAGATIVRVGSALYEGIA